MRPRLADQPGGSRSTPWFRAFWIKHPGAEPDSNPRQRSLTTHQPLRHSNVLLAGAFLVIHGLPPAPPGAGYQFWFICADSMVRGSEILVAGAGSTMFTTGMPETGGAVLGAALTVKPLGVSTGPPQGKELAHLVL